ncbi:MAG TPA: hypothetical protein DGG95_13235 [Cytophagales bacterium]|nr:hypothetical protein [Cytophagales bacterium]
MTMKIILACILIAYFSCKGQNQKSSEAKTELAAPIIGERVTNIGKDIDYILQDQSGNYWFASNGDDVYRYDGKLMEPIL